MGTWRTRTCVDTGPERVLSLLTDPEAGEGTLALRARGPFEIDARYEAVAGCKQTELRVSVSIHGSGLMCRLAAKAAEGLLAAGALDATVSRIARAAEKPEYAAAA